MTVSSAEHQRLDPHRALERDHQLALVDAVGDHAAVGRQQQHRQRLQRDHDARARCSSASASAPATPARSSASRCRSARSPGRRSSGGSWGPRARRRLCGRRAARASRSPSLQLARPAPRARAAPARSAASHRAVRPPSAALIASGALAPHPLGELAPGGGHRHPRGAPIALVARALEQARPRPVRRPRARASSG